MSPASIQTPVFISSCLLSRIEWQVLVPVFTSVVMLLEANVFIKVHGFHSLTKHASTSLGNQLVG